MDTRSALLCIHEHIVEVLNLRINGRRKIQLVNGFIQELDLAGSIEIRFKNRNSVCQVIVLPNNKEVLLGAIPMEEMDVLIHPDHPMAQVRV